MKTGMLRTLVLRTGAVTAFALAAAAGPTAAQSSDDCRCVDRDGNPIERCTCFRAPRIEGFGAFFGPRDARPRIGISVDVSQSARRDASGAMVTDVVDDGPADDAGIRRGDLITSLDGQSLLRPLAGSDAEDDFDLDRSIPVQRLLAIAAELEPGQEVEIRFTRDGTPRTATIEAEDLSSSWESSGVIPGWDTDRLREHFRGLADERHSFQYRDDLAELGARMRDDLRGLSRDGSGGTVRFFGDGDGPGLALDRYRGVGYGLELVALNPSLGSYFGADEGVLVADVQEDSTLGLRPGDIVTRIGDRPVTTPDHMRRILQSYGADEDITLQVLREGSDTTVTGRLGS
jgi:S1-C subfamily serine protease